MQGNYGAEAVLKVAVMDRACCCSAFPREAPCLVGVVGKAGQAVSRRGCIIPMNGTERRPRIHECGQ